MIQPNDTTTEISVMKQGRGTETRTLGVGIVGLGRSGWQIHAMTLKDMADRYRVVAVVDPSDERRTEARDFFDCNTYEQAEALNHDPDVDIVIIASPSYLHAEQTIAALDAGKHVVVEKPFAMSGDEAERMVNAAKERGLTIAPFQNRRFDSHYMKVKEIIRSGALGEIVQIRMSWHGFSRRWDWQAVRKFGGGALTNNGTHLLDLAIELFGENEPELFLDTKPGLTLGDADQHMKLVLRGEGSPTIDIEHTNTCIFPQDRWHIMGTAGGLDGTTEELRWRTVDWSAMPERKLDVGAAQDRLYNNEDIPWVEHSWRDTSTRRDPYKRFFNNLYANICDGEPLTVSPESVIRYVKVLDRCREMQRESSGE